MSGRRRSAGILGSNRNGEADMNIALLIDGKDVATAGRAFTELRWITIEDGAQHYPF